MFDERKTVQFVPPDLSNLQDKVLLKHKEYTVLKDLIYKKTGISLGDSKVTMLEARLNKRLRCLGVDSYVEYIECLNANESEMEEFVNAITTNKTDFFRESDHFKILTEKCLPEIIKIKNRNALRIWSAAASTGEESYTLAMVLTEYFATVPHEWDYKILGTDIDTDVLEKANQGIYPNHHLEDVNVKYREKYFFNGKDANLGMCKVVPELKSIIKFRYFNLISDNLPVQIKFDVIFLRNVLIYFNEETVQHVINKLYNMLNDGGYLFIGHSENLNRIKHKFKLFCPTIYKKD